MGSVGHRHRKGSANADGRLLLAGKEGDGLFIGGGSVDIGEGEVDVGEVEVLEKGDGSVALSDVRRERYCRKVADGVEPLEAWQQAFCDEEGKEREKKSNANVYRWRCSEREEVKLRIKWLSEEECESGITKKRKRSMLDALLEKTYERAMSYEASAKDVGACLDVMARHDMVHGDVVKPELKVVFPQLEAIFGAAATAMTEKRLGIGKSVEKLT